MRSLFSLLVFLAFFAWTPSAFSQVPAFEHRSLGLIHDGFMSSDGTKVWLAEDGGRIRYRDPSGAWTYQDVTDRMKDTLHRIHFLDTNDYGWAVGKDGYVLKTTDGGVSGWLPAGQILSLVQGQPSPYEDLFDVHFITSQIGWVVGLHGIWYTTDAGANWNPAMLLDSGGGILDPATIDLYAIDVVAQGNDIFALACATPGVVLRNVPATPGQQPGSVFQVIWEVMNDTSQVFTGCEKTGVAAGAFAPWDIEISRTDGASHPFALMAGGIGDSCGLIFSSIDDGVTWTKERHECESTPPGGTSPCAGNTLYENNQSTLTDTWRHQTLKTVYGLGLFDDRSAIAGGYNGQHIIRDPATGIWHDRSTFSDRPFEAVGAVYMPFFGAIANRLGTATTGRAELMGVTGLLRGTTDGGATWQDDLNDEQWRTTAVCFLSDAEGWYVGQFYRIAKSINGGLDWSPQISGADKQAGTLRAIAIKPGGQRGVAVGSPDHRISSAFQDRPKILRIDPDVPTFDRWIEPLTIQVESNTDWSEKDLRAVVWVEDETFWTAGQYGLVFVTENAGESWEQVWDQSMDVNRFQEYEFQGLDFKDASDGIFVGWSRTSTGGKALAYSGGNWSDISPAAPEITRINDVKIHENVAYAVADHVSGSVRKGVVLKSDYSAGVFGQFVVMQDQPTAFLCNTGFDLGRIPILNRIEVNEASGDIWVGGECGRVWRRTAQLPHWEEHQSQSDSHIVSMSMTPGGYLYLGMARQSATNSAIVRWRP